MLCFSKSTCQNPSDASSIEEYLGISSKASPLVYSGKCSLYTFNSSGSTHKQSFVVAFCTQTNECSHAVVLVLALSFAAQWVYPAPLLASASGWGDLCYRSEFWCGCALLVYSVLSWELPYPLEDVLKLILRFFWIPCLSKGCSPLEDTKGFLTQ